MKYGLLLDSGVILPIKAGQKRTARAALSRWNNLHRIRMEAKLRAGPFDPPVVVPRLAVGLVKKK